MVTEVLYMEFKDILKDLRIKNNLTQEALANAIHVSRSAIAKWEAGLGIPSEDSIEVLTNFFSVDYDFLFPNKKSESLLVEKNIKLNKNKMIIRIISSALIIMTTLFVILLVSYGLEKKNELNVPIVNDIYFNFNIGYPSEEIGMHNGKYVLFRKETKVYLEVAMDEILLEGDYDLKPQFRGFEVLSTWLYARGFDEQNNPRFIFCSLIYPEEDNVDELRLTELLYVEKTKRKTIEKKSIIRTPSLPIVIEHEDIVKLDVVLNTKTLISFEVPKGKNLFGSIFDSYHEAMLRDIVNAELNNTVGENRVRLNGFYRSDGKSLGEKVYEDIELLADVELNESTIPFTVSVEDATTFIYSTNFIPIINVNGKRYDNVKYELYSDSDLVEIYDNKYLYAVKPGDVEIEVHYDLGFYKGKESINLKIYDYTYVEVFGYDDVPIIKVNYDSELNELKIPDDILEAITDYFENINQAFEEKTNIKREFIRLERINDFTYIPIFETTYEIDYSFFNTSLEIGSNSYSLQKFPEVIYVKKGDFLSLGYSGNENYETEFIIYHNSLNNVLNNKITSDHEFDIFVYGYFEYENIRYFTDIKTAKIIVK